jgi:hypothetical protein
MMYPARHVPSTTIVLSQGTKSACTFGRFASALVRSGANGLPAQADVTSAAATAQNMLSLAKAGRIRCSR